jgi:hypothetical protein
MNRWIILFVFLSCFTATAESSQDYYQTIEESYFIWTRNDTRMCPSPYCGGFYVKAINRLLTSCVDGNENTDCQVLQIDFSILDMTEKEQSDFQAAFAKGLGIVKGKLIQVQQNGFLIPVLMAYETWLSQANQESDWRLFFSLHDNGIQCITTPCLTVDEGLVNRSFSRTIAGVDLYTSGADKEKIETAYQEMKTGFIIGYGRHKLVQGPAGYSYEFVAADFFLPIKKIETCGDIVCPAGETCCNSSCGICTPPGWSCIQIACE